MWTNGNGYFYEGDCRPGDREATAEELAAYLASQLRVALLNQIDTIERQTLMNRATREFMLAVAEQQGAAMGLSPTQLYAANIAYRSVKDIDTQIVALRSQL